MVPYISWYLGNLLDWGIELQETMIVIETAIVKTLICFNINKWVMFVFADKTTENIQLFEEI